MAAGDLHDPRGGDVHVSDWVIEWQLTRGTLKPSTRDADHARLPAVLGEFGHLRLRDITPTLVRQWVAGLSDVWAPKTVRHYHALLFGVLALAVDEGLLRRNPCVGTPLPEMVSREPVFLDESELAALIDAHPERWRALPLTLAGTGMRWAEAVGLRCRYVDLSRRELTVAWTYSGRHGWQTPKTKASRRTVTLPGKVVEALGGQLVGKGADAHVFTQPTGSPVNEGYRSRVWRRAVMDAGLAGKAPRPHDLRHTHASLLIAAGVPLTAIQRRLGHTSIMITSDVYGSLLPRVDETLVAALDVALGLEIPDTVPEGL